MKALVKVDKDAFALIMSDAISGYKKYNPNVPMSLLAIQHALSDNSVTELSLDVEEYYSIIRYSRMIGQ